MMNYSVNYRSTDWCVQSVYTSRDRNGKPTTCILRLTSPGVDFVKKITLFFHQVQQLVGCVVNVDDPEESLRGQWLRIAENAVLIGDLEVLSKNQ